MSALRFGQKFKVRSKGQSCWYRNVKIGTFSCPACRPYSLHWSDWELFEAKTSFHQRRECGIVTHAGDAAHKRGMIQGPPRQTSSKNKKAVLSQRWPRDARHIRGSNEPLRRYGHSKWPYLRTPMV